MPNPLCHHRAAVLVLVMTMLLLPAVAAERYYVLGLTSKQGAFAVDSLNVEDVPGVIEQPTGEGYTVSVLSAARQRLSSASYDLTLPELLLLYIPYEESGEYISVSNAQHEVLLEIPLDRYVQLPPKEQSAEQPRQLASVNGSHEEPQETVAAPVAGTGNSSRQEAPQDSPGVFKRMLAIAFILFALIVLFISLRRRRKERHERLHRIRAYVHHHARGGHPFRNIHYTLKRHGVEDHEIRTALRMKGKR